ncbi:1-phosphofructokinase [Pelosinus propionicus]|uniref:Tagatose-6-phosphate kinase n=1 Tax=Pelosinus propionicus DSM 13327 TaxID=1123291 RepID=A0A1I4JAM0_9FIRM|nr:1-phosphofructokinase [Pelosinus propionicus]SFL63251.1 fructose-1-phosphate kinase [Pelosinus propionicus DSM 13327]
MISTLPIVTVTLNPALDRTLHLPNFTLGKVNRVDTERTDPGGKGINVAKVISALGNPAVVTGFLGKKNAYLFKDYFKEKNITDCFVETAGENRENIKIVDTATDVVSELNFPGMIPTIADLKNLQDILCQLAVNHKWFVLSGSLPLNVPADIYATFIETLHQYDCNVILDTSGPALSAGIAAKPFAVKPNLPELSQLMQAPMESDKDILEAVKHLLRLGISQVAISLGEKGSLVGDCQQILRAKAPTVPVSSTVGAGDAFVAGFSVGQARCLCLADSIRLASAAASASVILPGTQAASLSDVTKLIDKIQIEEWR